MAARGGILKLLDAYIAIGGDTSGFDKAVAQSEAKTKQAGGRLESMLSPRRVFGAFATAAGAAFGIAGAGAAELNRLTAEFTAQTGLAGDEAKAFSANLSGLYRTNLQGFDEIGAALIGLQLNFKLTGDEAKVLGAQFLDFSRIAGGTAAESVGRFDELVDAGVITADQMAITMDKLIVSHQKFGVDINGTIAALVKFAPAMTAAGISTDDAIGLMNMFSESGLDAETAAKAFTIALGKVKSPEELQRLIANISATEDPFKRGQLAADLFGKKAGVLMANALKPGTGGLEAFSVKEGEVVGKTTEAGDALDSSFGAQFKLLMKNAGGALAEFGVNFDALIIAASMFGPKFITAIGAGLGGLGGLLIPKIAGPLLGAAGVQAWMTTGTKIGTLIGAAAAVAIPAAIVVGVVLVAQEVDRQNIAKAATADLIKARDEMVKAVAERRGNPLAAALFGDLSGVQKVADSLTAEIERRGAELGGAFVDGYTSVLKEATAAGAAVPAALAAGVRLTATKELISPAEVLAMFGTSLSGVISAAYSTGADGMSAMAAAITASRAKPLDAFETLKEMLKNSMTPMAEVARLAGDLTSKELARGLKDGRPDVRAQALATVKEHADRLAELAKQGGPAGRAALHELSAGIRSKIPEVSRASLDARRAAVAELDAAKKPAGTAGEDVGTAFAKGVKTKVTSILDWVSNLHGNPDVSITVVRKGGAASAAAGMPYVPTNMPVYVHEREAILSVPQAEAWRAGSGGAGSGGGGNSYTYNFPVHVQGLVRARDPLEIATQMRRLARFGVLTPKAVPA